MEQKSLPDGRRSKWYDVLPPTPDPPALAGAEACLCRLEQDSKPEKASDAIVFNLEKKNVVLAKKVMTELERNRRIDRQIEEVKVRLVAAART